MANITARLSLEDNYSSAIMKATNSTSNFEKQVKAVKESIKDVANSKIDVKNDEAIKKIRKTKEAINSIKKHINIMVAAKDLASGSVNRIGKNVNALVKKRYALEIKAIDKTKSIIAEIKNNIFSLKTLAAGIVLGGTTKLAFDNTIGAGAHLEQEEVAMKHFIGNNNKSSKSEEIQKMTDDFIGQLRKNANETPFGTNEVLSAGRRSINIMQGDTKKSMGLVTLAENMASLNPGKSVMDAMEALADLKTGEFERMKEFGFKFSAEEFKKLAGKGKNDDLADSEMTKAYDLLVKDKLNPTFDGGADKLSKTAAGQWSTTTGNIESIFSDLGKTFLPAINTVLTPINAALDRIGNSKAFANLQKDLMAFADEAGNKAVKFLDNLANNPEKLEEYKNNFKDFLKDLKGGYEVAKEFAKAIGTVGTVLKPVFTLIAEHPKLFVGLFAGLQAGKGAFNIMNTFKNIKKGLPLLIDSIKIFGTNFVNVFKNIGVVLMANPIILIITGIIAAIALLYAAWTNDWGGIREKTEKAINSIKEKFDNFKKTITEFKDNALKKAKEEFDKLKDTIIDLKDKAIKKANEKFDDFKKTLKDNQKEIKVTSVILGTIFGPALLSTATKATIAGAKIAAHFIASMVKAGYQAIVNGAKIAAHFIASMVKSGYQAVVNGIKITASFIASMIKAGTQAVISGIKITAHFIASMVKAGVEATIAGGKIMIGFVASLVKAAFQATVTAAVITGRLIVALISYVVQGWKAVFVTGAQTVSLGVNAIALGAQKIALIATTAATKAATAAQWLFNVALDANPIGIVIVSLTALGIALYEIVKHWKDICEWIEKAWKWLTTWNDTKVSEKKIPGSGPQGLRKDSGVQEKALGTSYFSGGLTWVGEVGPELLELPKGSKIFNNRKSMNMVKDREESSPINNPFSGQSKAMLNQSTEWGKDIPNNLAQGIKNNTKSVTDAVTFMATKIRELIHFSVPDKGPLSDFDTYSVDMLNNFGEGIKNNTKLVVGPTTNMSADVKSVYSKLSVASNSYGQQAIQEFGNGIQAMSGNLTEIVKTLTDKVIETFKSGFGIHSPSRVMFEMGGHLMQGLVNGITSKDMEGFVKGWIGSMTNAAGGAISGNLAGWITAAMALTGVGPEWFGPLATLIEHESGGDPMSINLWDWNAQQGHPSKGLMQLIDENMQDHHLPGMDNIYDPISNIAAGIRLIQHDYGSIYNVPGIRALSEGRSYVGYATGTEYATPGYHWVGEKGPELLKFNGGEQVVNNKDSMKLGNNVTIEKLADTLVVREDADIDKIVEKLVKKLDKVAYNMA